MKQKSINDILKKPHQSKDMFVFYPEDHDPFKEVVEEEYGTTCKWWNIDLVSYLIEKKRFSKTNFFKQYLKERGLKYKKGKSKYGEIIHNKQSFTISKIFLSVKKNCIGAVHHPEIYTEYRYEACIRVLCDTPNFKFHDGGRQSAGYKGNVPDCVTRALAISESNGENYKEVYKIVAKKHKEKYGVATARKAMHDDVVLEVYASLGYSRVFPKTKKSKISDLPKGTFLVWSKGHVACVKDNVVYDTWDSSGKIVESYFVKK